MDICVKYHKFSATLKNFYFFEKYLYYSKKIGNIAPLKHEK
jgi:hypothetical protein